MIECKPLLPHISLRMVFAMAALLCAAASASASSLSEYDQHLKQAVTALNTLSQSGETETPTEYGQRDEATIRQVRNLLPPKESVEVNGATLTVDNVWLHQEIDKYAADTSQARYQLLQGIAERLQALDERIEELETAAAGRGSDKAANNLKLAEILKRPEYAHKVQQQNPLSRLLERFMRWLRSWLPKPKPISPGSAGVVTRVAQWVVILLALAVIAFAARLLLPRVMRYRRPKKTRKEKARIVLGETLEPDQSARDLLSEAEALAGRGELRAAIRRAYIALLVELGERKIISLAQYKTNRDYLRAMRELEPLYRNVKQMTDSFELHWYGLAQADETDWQEFRSAYDHALAR